MPERHPPLENGGVARIETAIHLQLHATSDLHASTRFSVPDARIVTSCVAGVFGFPRERVSCNGEGGIRTHGDPKATPVFKTGAFNRSATSPDVLDAVPRP